MHIKTPDVVIKTAWKKIPGNVKVAFIAALIIGIFTHIYMLTNTLPNHDEFKNMAESLAWAGINTGRWFLPVVGALTGIFTMPWVNGILTITFFSISASLVVSMMKVKRHLYSALIAGIMVTIPMVAAFLTYMGPAPSNVSSILLACLAAYIASKYKLGYIFATIPMVLSLAVYQISFGVTAALLIIVLILEILENETPWQKTLIKGIKYFGTLIAGLLMYLLSIRIIFPDGLPIDYQGLGQMGQVNWAYLPHQIRTAYFEIVRFFLLDTRNYHYPFMNILFVLSFIACAVLVIMWCIKKKLHKEPLKPVLLGVLIILFPLACNLIYLMGASWVHDLMIYPTVFVPVFLIIIVDRYFRESKSEDNGTEKSRSKKRSEIIASISAWIITITMAISMFNYVVISNQVYFRLNIGYQVTYAQSILLISRIQELEGYTEDMDVIIVGSPYIPQGIPELHDITIMGANGPELLLDSWAYPYFLRRHLNFPNNVEFLQYWIIHVGMLQGDEGIINAVNTVRDMPIYPARGSIAIIDGVIYVRHHYIDVRPSYRVG